MPSFFTTHHIGGMFFPELNEPARPAAGWFVSARAAARGAVQTDRLGESAAEQANRQRRTCRGQNNGGV